MLPCGASYLPNEIAWNESNKHFTLLNYCSTKPPAKDCFARLQKKPFRVTLGIYSRPSTYALSNENYTFL